MLSCIFPQLHRINLNFCPVVSSFQSPGQPFYPKYNDKTEEELKNNWKTSDNQLVNIFSTIFDSQMLNRMHLDPWSPSTIRPLWHSACHMCRLDISAWNQKWRFKLFHWIFSLLFLTIPVQFFCWQNRNFCLWTLGIAQSQNQWSVWHLNYRSLACVFEEFRFCYFIFCFVLNLLSRMPFHF